MNRLIIIILTLSLFGMNCVGQKVASPKMDHIFLDQADSTKNCYTIIYPPKHPWQGYVFLVPGFGETAENVLLQTELPKKLAQHGILTIIPTFQDGTFSFGVDSLSQQSLINMIKD